MPTLVIDHASPKQILDLKVALDRALNTWENAPEDLLALSDQLTAGQVFGIAFYTMRPFGEKNTEQREIVEFGRVVTEDPYMFANHVTIKTLVNNFLGWKLPEDFSPDNGVRFSPPSFDWPTGTNLLNAQQARQMFAHCLGITK